ncbi:MAG: redoxin domain-containing protein [Planctomycetes bacterium]|nr:redoxin domain-containing protein [Planctomycetota bacterium]
MNGYRRRKPGTRGVLRAATPLLVAGALAAPSQAEFTVGAEVPALTLQTAAGKTVEVRRTDGTLTVQFDDERMQPKVLVIHLLQPDCLQCRAQLQALKPIAEAYRGRGVFTLGIAHRGTLEAARELTRELDLPFPVAPGVDSEIARQFAAGDTLGITDGSGIVRFAQVGYGEGDAKLWEQAIEELIADKPVTKAGVDRERLGVGHRLPAIHLPSLRSGKPMSLAGEGERLVLRDDAGKTSRPKAAIGFFSRY